MEGEEGGPGGVIEEADVRARVSGRGAWGVWRSGGWEVGSRAARMIAIIRSRELMVGAVWHSNEAVIGVYETGSMRMSRV